MKITIRNETDKDYAETENLTREAFWDVYKPGCDEHLVLHNLRVRDCFVKELDYVVVHDGRIVGNSICTKAKVIDGDKEHEVLTLGPISVLPEYQKKGIGSKLMNQTITKARELGYKGIIIFGNPAYYHRFGFKNAKEYRIATKDGGNLEPFMALELQKDNLKEVKGRFHIDDAFYVNAKELEEYDKRFPYKEKHKTATQLGV